jgi:hypothetical protein
MKSTGHLFGQIVKATLVVAAVGSLTSYGLDTDQLINDLNNQLQDEGEIYFDPNCADDDGDGWCD